MNYLCPVCGYDRLDYPPQDFSICPSCGTEFGNTDFEQSWDELRAQWIVAGFPWSSKAVPQPTFWNPIIQLQNVLPTKTNSVGTINRVEANTQNLKRIEVAFKLSAPQRVNLGTVPL